jgi:hypothetical protein
MDGAGAARTGVGAVAVKTIIAGSVVVDIQATRSRVAGVVGAVIAIIADERQTTQTDAIGTGVSCRTGIVVSTRTGFEQAGGTAAVAICSIAIITIFPINARYLLNDTVAAY